MIPDIYQHFSPEFFADRRGNVGFMGRTPGIPPGPPPPSFFFIENMSIQRVESLTPVQSLSLVLPEAAAAGTYCIRWSYSCSQAYEASTYYFRAQVQVDDTLTLSEHGHPVPAQYFNPAVGFAYVELLAGTHTIDLDVWMDTGAAAIWVRRRRITAELVS